MVRVARVAAGAQKELDIAKTEMVKIAKVATAAQRELDIARGGTRLLNKVINGLQQRLDKLEGRGSVGSDHPPLESGSSTTTRDLDQAKAEPTPPAEPPGVAPAPVPPPSAPPLIRARAAVTSACRPGSGSEEWRDEWLSAKYHNRRAPPGTPVRPRRPAPAQEPIPMAGGRYGGLRDEVPGGDIEWDVAEARKTWRRSALPRRVVHDGRLLNAAAGDEEA